MNGFVAPNYADSEAVQSVNALPCGLRNFHPKYNHGMKLFQWFMFQRDTQDVANAKALLKAIDRGGVPSNPAKVNDIARQLGLEVSRSAPMSETIERIRLALKRQ